MSAGHSMITPFVDEGLGNSSYVVDLGDRRGLVMDPVRDVGPYARLAADRGLQLAYCLETHLHADFVSGSRELAALGSEILAPRAAELTFPYRGLEDDEEADLDGLTLRAIGTPGHTPEHLAYLLLDGSRPVALFSGGSLLVGSVARTDLISPEQTQPLGRSLYRALRERILSLPDELAVYPTHGAGSFCSTPGGGERTTTIGRERSSNPLLAALDEEQFLRLLTASLGTYPDYFLRLREVNRRGPRVYGADPPVLAQLDLADVQRRLGQGAALVDARPVTRFAAGHVPGAISIALRDAFASWLGWLLAPDRPLIFVLDQGQDRADLVRQCLKIGYEDLAGELAGGMAAWDEAGLPQRRTRLIADPTALEAPILDVRQTAEYTAAHIPGAVHVELGSLPDEADRLAPNAATVMCGAGERAMTAASLLEREGAAPAVFRGSVHDWQRAHGEPPATGR